MAFAVTIHEKSGQPRRQEFDKTEVTIGRVQGNDIILPKQNVSKRHSRIVVKDGKFIIVDLKSTNGTYVNGRKIASPMVIKETDKIYIGDFILSAEPIDDAGTKATPMADSRPKAPPPPPIRKPPAAQRPTATARKGPSLPPRPRPGRPAAESAAPAPIAEPKPAVAAPAPAPAPVPSPASPSPVAAPTEQPGFAASVADVPTSAPATLTVSAEQAPQELYRWLREYARQHGISLPVGYDIESGSDRGITTRLLDAARTAIDNVSGIDPQATAERCVAEVIGAGPLGELLGDASIERIYYNGPRQGFITRAGETVSTEMRFSSAQAMKDCVLRLVGQATQPHDTPRFLSGYLNDGSRVHFVSADAGGPFITIDRPAKDPLSLQDLVSLGVLNDNMATYLHHAVNLGRVILVSGNDIDARSRVLSAILHALGDETRAILIDSSGRIALPNERSIRMSATRAGTNIVREAVRMRPDFLVVADAAGYSTLDALFAMGTNVNGGGLGVDAESPEVALQRVARLAAVSADAQENSAESLVRDRIDILVQVLTYADGTDRITQISDVHGELQDTFTGFDEFSGNGQPPQWYEDAIRLGHPLEDHLFN